MSTNDHLLTSDRLLNPAQLTLLRLASDKKLTYGAETQIERLGDLGRLSDPTILEIMATTRNESVFADSYMFGDGLNVIVARQGDKEFAISPALGMTNGQSFLMNPLIIDLAKAKTDASARRTAMSSERKGTLGLAAVFILFGIFFRFFPANPAGDITSYILFAVAIGLLLYSFAFDPWHKRRVRTKLNKALVLLYLG